MAAKPRPVLMSRPRAHDPAIRYGWHGYASAVAADKFARMFSDRGIPVVDVSAPEQAKNPLFKRLSGLDEGEHLHLIFRATDEIRIMDGAYNVCCFSWEFDRLKHDAPPQESVVHDQVRMLQLCDEVWATSHYTAQVLRAHGVATVHVVPAPVRVPRRLPASGLGAVSMRTAVPLISISAIDESVFRTIAARHAGPLGDHARVNAAQSAGRLFLTVCHPMDLRKNLPTLIDGFRIATAGIDNAALVVKLVNTGPMEQPFDYLFHQIRPIFAAPHCLHEEGVVLFADTLPEVDMQQLYAAADFYLCASLGEGQNLSLLEAMANGAVPVSVTNTAMADYLSTDNAIRIAGRTFSGLVTGLAGDVTRSRLSVSFSDRTQVAAAITEALALDPGQRASLSRAAVETVRSGYDDEAVMATLTRRLKETRPAVVPASARLRPSWWR